MDVQISILKHLNIPDLLSVAESDQRLWPLAASAFRQTHSKKIFKILNPYASKFTDDFDGDEIIYIEAAKSILKFLKYFGQSISNLDIIYSLNKENTTITSSLNGNINLYCSETLVQIEIQTYNEHFFDEMTRPFTKAQNITIRGRFQQLGNSMHTFDE